MPENIVPHSIRATAATQLYHQGVPEQLICESSGNRSEAVRNYDRSSLQQHVDVQKRLHPYNNVGDMLQNTTNISIGNGENQKGTQINSLFKQANVQCGDIHIYFHGK